MKHFFDFWGRCGGKKRGVDKNRRAYPERFGREVNLVFGGGRNESCFRRGKEMRKNKKEFYSTMRKKI